MGRVRRAIAVSSLTSLGLIGFAGPVEAAGGSLAIDAIDRTGQATSADVWVLNTATNRDYSFSSAKPHALPNGHYGVVVAIASDGTQTVGGRTFTVKGARVALRFDARKGKRITITPSTRSPYRMMYSADVCVAGMYLGGISGAQGVEDYAIPTSNRKVRLSATAEWEPTSSGPYYWAVGKPTDGIPTHPGYSWAHASFAKLSVKVRAGTIRDPQTSLMLVPDAPCSGGSVSFATFAAPRTVTAYVSTGRWTPYIIYNGGQSGPSGTPYYKAGKTYHLTFTRKR